MLGFTNAIQMNKRMSIDNIENPETMVLGGLNFTETRYKAALVKILGYISLKCSIFSLIARNYKHTNVTLLY